MNIKQRLLSLLILLTGSQLFAQQVVEPNYGLKSPETVEIIRVRITDSETLVDLSIQNLARDGYFCIDENTYIESPGGQKLKLQKVSGLPICPDTYKFKTVGEKVYFTLVFDNLPAGTEWFDIVEYCGDNCLTIFGINLDEKINTELNDAFSAMDRLDPAEAISIFEDLLPELQESGHALTGSIYINLVELFEANSRNSELIQLLSEFRSAVMPQKERYSEILSSMGY